ncbi:MULTISPECIES: NADH-quinone oxidoreductase subunit L [Halomonas]|uniref:Probable inorganic carbon transporter subunit DabB n=1 Tax=Halomonas halophila TaxID=29573 RepID=A0ABQ0U811_9GAMM|nr:MULTISPECIES: NADH-quinone oxidoreductase subunit L [Halomonas]MDR5890586.1 NADH-quinone oxidoreductase subunit L [Halomonas salina]WJY06049.1 NADH-quinone oxidoreductase subunit L [Halomonas halophila]GEK74633.1 NADH dehydrogenase subunit L [Halomonas halophila]
MHGNALFFTFLLTLVPAILALGAVTSARGPRGRAWRIGRITTTSGLLLSASLLVLGLASGLPAVAGWWHSGMLQLVMLLLANFIAFVVVRYSTTYLQGEPRQRRFVALVQAVFAAVSVAVLSDHLLAFLFAWLGISLAMHQLLMFYPDRPRAALAAHKKFLFARAAELCAMTAFLLLYLHHDTGRISVIVSDYASADGALTLGEQAAACLLALAALIKCAQLPLHGWLIQVVEAPTPVSATLHGGVINLGGYLLLLFSPLLLRSAPAQALVLTVAGLGSVLAALVMMTRVSIKVRLAWSTSAQMGLMLVEIALGLTELAMLHLLAHSCYKAYAFLSSGEAVEQDLLRRQAPGRSPTPSQWLVAGLISVSLVAAVVALARSLTEAAAFDANSPWVLLALALTVLLAERNSERTAGSVVGFVGLAALVVLAYVGLKTLFAAFLPETGHRVSLWGDLWVSALFVLLFAGYWLKRHGLHYPASQTLNRYCYAGFYLDEWVTRNTLRLWPHDLPGRIRAKQLHTAFRGSAQ